MAHMAHMARAGRREFIRLTPFERVKLAAEKMSDRGMQLRGPMPTWEMMSLLLGPELESKAPGRLEQLQAERLATAAPTN